MARARPRPAGNGKRGGPMFDWDVFREEACVLQVGFWLAVGALIAVGGIALVYFAARFLIRSLRR